MNMEQLKLEMLGKSVWAVVGATPNQEKFGNKIYKKLKSKGYEVYAVNPNYDEVEGDRCYHSIEELPVKPDCVDMVVAPPVSKKFIPSIAEAGIKYLWFQPGSFDDEAISLAEDQGIQTVYHHCVLVALA